MSDFIPNSTQMPNLYLDRLLALLSGNEWKVVSYMARRLFGFQKRRDRISIGQICNGVKNRKTGQQLDYGTGLNNATVLRALAELETYGIARQSAPADKAKNIATEWELQLNSDQVDWAGLEARQEAGKKRTRKRTKAGRKAANEGPGPSNRPGANEEPGLSNRPGHLVHPIDQVDAKPSPSNRPPLVHPIDGQKKGETKIDGDGISQEENRPFNPPKIRGKAERYSALRAEPELRDRAQVAMQLLGVTHFGKMFSKRKEATGRKILTDQDWQEILDWCAYYEGRVSTGKIQMDDVARLLVANIRDADPVPIQREAIQMANGWANHVRHDSNTDGMILDNEEDVDDVDDGQSEQGGIWGEAMRTLRRSMTRHTYAIIRGATLVEQGEGRLIVSVTSPEALQKLHAIRQNVESVVSRIAQQRMDVEFRIGEHRGQA